MVSRSKLSCANTKFIPMYLIRINKCNACDIIRNLNSNRPIQFFVRSVLDFPSALTQRRVDEIACDLKKKLKKASDATILDRSRFGRFYCFGNRRLGRESRSAVSSDFDTKELIRRIGRAGKRSQICRARHLKLKAFNRF